MKIAILGTRGIPNYYGGFEQFAEFFATHAAQVGHEVYVYNSHNHPFQEKTFQKVHLIHCYDPEYKIGTAGQFIYDLNCIRDARKRNFDIILQLGYTSSAIWYSLHPKNTLVITNMDGLEWKRTKYSKTVQKVLLKAEKRAVLKSDFLISDSIGIQDYIYKTYKKNSEYIAYGANPFETPNEVILEEYNVSKDAYFMVMARFEPENNIEMVLDGVVTSKTTIKILVIGNYNTKHGNTLKTKYSNYTNIIFLGALYNLEHLNNLRYFASLYFHGHTVGGTNPSLLEAMASQTLIVAHNNDFNKGILKENAFYFLTSDEVAKCIQSVKKNDNLQLIKNNLEAIYKDFNWNTINEQYLQFFQSCLQQFERSK